MTERAIANISIFIENEDLGAKESEVDVLVIGLFHLRLKIDTSPIEINTKGMIRPLIFSLIEISAKVQKPDIAKLNTEDKIRISILEKYLVILKIFKNAYPGRNDAQMNASTNCVTPPSVPLTK
jgi:hypothetical protein